MQLLICLPLFLLEALLSHAFLSDLLPKRSEAVRIDRHSLSSNAIHEDHHRRMVAARSISDLNKRASSLDGVFKKHIELRYVHGDPLAAQPQRRSVQAQTQFSANVQMDADLPTMLLEDIDDHLEEVNCQPSSIELHFKDPWIPSAVQQKAQYSPDVIVITSHLGCNDEGERKPHLVHGIEKTESSLTLRIRPTSWEDSFHHVNVHFGNDPKIEPFQPIKKRQAAVVTAASAAASASVSFPAANASVSFPSAPTTTPTITSVHQASIDHSWIDTSIVPPNFPGVDSSSPVGLTVNCKNCSIQGSIDLSYANFSAGNSNDTVTEVGDFIKEGTLEFALNDLATHMELESTVQASTSPYEYKAPIPDIHLTPFYIPGIATVGPVVRPTVSISVQVSAQLDFSYGFDLNLPGTASITLDLAHPGNSSVVGFHNPQVSALPFQSQIDHVNLTVSVGFSPELLLNAMVLDNYGQIGAGVFFDLPKLSATFSQVDHVDDKCNPTNATDTYKDFISNSLTHIVPSVDLDVGVLADVKVHIPDVPYNISDGGTDMLFSTQYSLPTACLSFDKAKKTYGAVAATTDASAHGHGGSKSSGAASLRYDERLLGATLLLMLLLLAGLDHV